MDIEKYRSEAEYVLAQGHVRSVEFSGPTYQVEVYDPEAKESFWPFLKFNERGELQDAFCSCPSAEDGCSHLSAAYLRIFDQKLLHIRFERSFWNHLCALFADHTGYEGRFLKKKGEGHYLFENGVHFEIKAKKKEALTALIENRPKETPETSLKFSNFSQEEIGWWKDGRPSPELRYTLSFWSDLAKWIFEERGKLTFTEDDEGFPTQLKAVFPSFTIDLKMTGRDLIKLIPTLDTLDASLKVLQSPEQVVAKIAYDSKKQEFSIEHGVAVSEKKEEIRQIDEWAYLPGKGFYSRDGETFLSRDRVTSADIPAFLEESRAEISRFVPIHETPMQVSYTMHFDPEWNWHFAGYLFEKGDLEKRSSNFFGSWAYLEGRGFYPLEDPLFETAEALLAPDQISRFVNHHRIWLNGQEGFQTHLTSIESQIIYEMKQGGELCFRTKAEVGGSGSMDFGEWVYYNKLGFFSKKRARVGLIVRPGLEIQPNEISSFIKTNREELESIPGFFTQHLPVEERGLEVMISSSSTVHVKPIYKSRNPVRFFGDFVFQDGIGFSELPTQMRLPEGYQEEKIIRQSALGEFLAEELPRLKKSILKLDPRLKIPLKSDLTVHYLVRTPRGGLKAQLFFHTELGKVAVTDIYEAFEKKQRYIFSDGGLIDLHEELYQWVRHLKLPVHPESQSVELSTMEFIRLDASFGFLGPPEIDQMAIISKNLIKELRNFTAHETPNLKGLKSELRLYQQTGLNWLWFLYKNGLSGLLCDDMGLGKTHQAMALISAILNQKNHSHRILVVCPTSVIYHWQDKLETFLPSIKVHTFHGLKRTLKRLPKEGLILTTYGVLRLEKKNIQEIPFDLAVFDEIQVAKNSHSRVHDALTHVDAQMKVGLTGTPIENNLRELKSLFDIVLPGYMPGETRFRDLFINPIERDLDEEKKNLLSTMIRPFILRRRKSEVLQELPEKSEDKSYCELSEEQIKLYRETLMQNRDETIADLRDRDAKVNYIHVFSILSRLKQICNHPALVEKDPKNYKNYVSGKWELFCELLDEARESEQKVVVFSQYLYQLDIIESYLKEQKWGYAQIRGDTINRREELKRFQEDPACVVFIGSLQAAGLGIDLTAASVVIMYDRWWNAARENQAIDRVHRMGQKWGVQVYKLITKGTIEEKIDRMIMKKGQLMEEIIASDDQAMLKKFTRSELIDLLSFSA